MPAPRPSTSPSMSCGARWTRRRSGIPSLDAAVCFQRRAGAQRPVSGATAADAPVWPTSARTCRPRRRSGGSVRVGCSGRPSRHPDWRREARASGRLANGGSARARALPALHGRAPGDRPCRAAGRARRSGARDGDSATRGRRAATAGPPPCLSLRPPCGARGGRDRKPSARRARACPREGSARRRWRRGCRGTVGRRLAPARAPRAPSAGFSDLRVGAGRARPPGEGDQGSAALLRQAPALVDRRPPSAREGAPHRRPDRLPSRPRPSGAG
jgi:hypothetical protein